MSEYGCQYLPNSFILDWQCFFPDPHWGLLLASLVNIFLLSLCEGDVTGPQRMRKSGGETHSHTYNLSFSLLHTHSRSVYSRPCRLTISCRPPSFLITSFFSAERPGIAFRVSFHRLLCSERVIHSPPHTKLCLSLISCPLFMRRGGIYVAYATTVKTWTKAKEKWIKQKVKLN